jgi:hypothetical protein
MARPDYWLTKFSKLRIDRAGGDPAAHKPLLLLVLCELVEKELVLYLNSAACVPGDRRGAAKLGKLRLTLMRYPAGEASGTQALVELQ